MLLQTAIGWNTNLWRFCETAQNVLQITTRMSQIGKKTREERKNKSGFVPPGRSCMCDSAEDSYSTLCPHDKLAPKAKCGHTQRQSSDAEGRGEEGGGVVVVVEKKNQWHACATMETHLVTAPALPA